MKKKFLLRISPELWDELERWASAEMRSVNAQIEFLLRDAAKQRRGKELPAEADDGERDGG